MCGIAGVVGLHGHEDVAVLAHRLWHRGPDEGGEFSDATCSLGMRRLSIIDPTGGHQPIYNESRDLVCVCNGELYNFHDLSQELAREGHRFATGSDIEVAVHGYEQWGDAVVRKINGMFGLALWDVRRSRLVLARDKLGKKPLYYAPTANGGLAFSSELRSILALPAHTWTLDRAACQSFCVLGYMPGDVTPIREIRRLLPGHIGVWERGTFTIKRYWEPEPTTPPADGDSTDALFALLRDAVRLRLISDVPLGAFLSGGLDSSLIVAMAAGELGAQIPTFSISFPGYPDHDEGAHARRVAEYFGCAHHEFPIDASDFRDIRDTIWALDEPLADPAALPTFVLSREAKKHVTVALTGEGADEIFGGYDRYRLALRGAALTRRLPMVGLLAGMVLDLRASRRTDDTKSSRILRAVTGGGDAVSWSRAIAMAPALGADRVATHTAQLGRPTLPRVDGNGELLAVQMDDLSNALCNGLLTKVDRMSMAASLEARCPFLDYRVVNFGLGLPDRLKIRGRTSKVILRALAQRLLPPGINRRPKHTFRVPVSTWLRGPLQGLVHDVVNGTLLDQSGIAGAKMVRSVAERHLSGRADYSRALWGLITLHVWLSEARRQFRIDVPE